MTLEDIDTDLGRGSEFTYQNGTSTEVHQVKRQNGNSNSWTVRSLAALNVFDVAAGHVEAGRDFHFVSLVPCRPLQELAERARRSTDLASFTQCWLTGELRPTFDQLTHARILGSPQRAWNTLRGMWFSVQDEYEIVRMNAMLAGIKLSGATGDLISIAIGDILLNSLGRRLTRAELLDILDLRGIRPVEAASRKTARDQVRMVASSWRESIRRELLEPRIEREEANQLLESMHDHRTGFLAGTAGGGKSSVLEQSVEMLESAGAEVLAFRLDRIDSFASTIELGRRLGLDRSPAEALALAAEDRDAYLVIDQLDAVSLASGRMPESFDVVEDVIGEALSMTGMKVILACREFDIDNDHRIQSVVNRMGTAKISVGLLSGETIDSAVAQMGLEVNQITASQRLILQTPMHLVLLKTIVGHNRETLFKSKASLFEAYWERKRQNAWARRSGVRFNEVLKRVANEMSERQTLSIPVEVLDDGDLIDDANVLVSEHVLARDGDRIAFFHETFFDYAFARLWISRREPLIEFLLRDEQELFRRAQVRQILQHLSERDPQRFRNEITVILASDRVRFHIKDTVIAVLANLSAPTSEDSAVVLDVAAIEPGLETKLWSHTRRYSWFSRFQEDGQIDEWLDSRDPALQARALNLMMTSIIKNPTRVAELLRVRQGAPRYLEWVRWIFQGAEAHHSRELFDLLLDAVRAGGFDAEGTDLWLTARSLAKHKPLWAIELLRARIIDHEDALAVNDDGVVTLLKLHDSSASKLVSDAAAAEPLAFVQSVVPYLLQVMAATDYEDRLDTPIIDRHFSVRFDPEPRHDRDLDEALFTGSIGALEELANSNSDDVRPLLERLASDPHDAAQFMLYRALIAGVTNFTDWAADLLLNGGGRLDCGYMSDPHWVARQLLHAVAPHVSDEMHGELENQFRDLRNPYEKTHSFGRTAFTFLSAMQESRLSPTGFRRLAEYRRKFGETEPAEPVGITGGIFGSPITSDSATMMTDEQWLSAMARYDSDERSWHAFTGGARELSHVLRTQTATDPNRFARFSLRLTADYNAAYAEGLLMGFSDAEHSDETAPLIFQAVRHIASLGHTDVDRWLGDALRRYYREAPLDLVELILDRALHSSDPADDTPTVSWGRDGGRSAADMRDSAINTARGSLAEALGVLLVNDADGKRTEVVRPHLGELASDPVTFVRSSVAHTVASALRFARSDAIAAFELLINTDDRILATGYVRRLMIWIGNVEPVIVEPVIERMLESPDNEVREEGGRLAAFAALEWELPELMTRSLAGDKEIRKGAAEVCANRVDCTSNAELATAALLNLMNDEETEVRQAVGQGVARLRNHTLHSLMRLIGALIESPSYEHATPQLLITLLDSPDKVDELVVKASQRFISTFESEAGDIRTGGALGARYVSQLIVRGLAQSRDKKLRSQLLDVLDRCISLGVYGIDDVIAEYERQ